METQYLREFILLAEVRNYRTAAGELGIAASSLTKHIALLEKEIGAALFDRTTRKVELSDYGRQFLPYANRALTALDQGVSSIQSRRDAVNETITVGMSNLNSIPSFDTILNAFQADYPACIVNIVKAAPDMLIERLHNGTCDMVYLRLPENDTASVEGFQKVKVGGEQLTVCLADTHPLAAADSVRIQDLKDQPLILGSPHSESYIACTKLCREAGFEPQIIMTDNSNWNCMVMASRGIGAALLSRKLSQPVGMPGIRILPLLRPFYFEVCLIAPSVFKSAAAADFYAKCAKVHTDYLLNRDERS